jgi:hypothetical protein
VELDLLATVEFEELEGMALESVEVVGWVEVQEVLVRHHLPGLLKIIKRT